MSECYSFGTGLNGQLGIGSDVDYDINEPTLIPGLKDKIVIMIAASAYHCAAVTDGGELYTWGNNEYGQLGRRRKIGEAQRVEALENQFVIQAACGQHHTLVLTSDYKVFAFGRNDRGQLGISKDEFDISFRPKLIKSLSDKNIVRIACGSFHSLALSGSNRAVWSWGSGRHGQTGRGNFEDVDSPLPVMGLLNVPVSSIYCGHEHSILLTESGNVYSFGRNNEGQLGTRSNNTSFPTWIKFLSHKNITNFSCFGNHNIAIGDDLYVWGSSTNGELFTEFDGNLQYPQIIHNNRVISIACGSKHTLLVKVEHGEQMVYSLGEGNHGQLGSSSFVNTREPILINLPKSSLHVKQVYAGSQFSIVVLNEMYIPPRFNEIKSISLDQTVELIEEYAHKNIKNLTKIATYLTSTFSWPSIICGSFLRRNYIQRSGESGIDLYEVRAVLSEILKLGHPKLIQLVSNSLYKSLSKFSHSTNDVNPETLRILLIAMENPAIVEPTRNNLSFLERLTQILVSLSQPEKDIIIHWWSKLSSPYFARTVKVMRKFLFYLVKNQISAPIVRTTKILVDLCEINSKLNIVPGELFNITNLSDHIDMVEEYKKWKGPETVFSFLRYKFLLDPITKIKVLRIDAMHQMGIEVQSAMMQLNIPFLLLNIRRNFIVEDTLDQISRINPREFKKPLKIHFVGEEGIDEGGLTKEFFQQIFTELLNYEYGMFVVLDEVQQHWINRNSLENETQFFLVGTLLGLALYNNVIHNFQFPQVFYKKLLGIPVNFNDLKSTYISVAQNLEYMLNYEGDIEETFGEYFQVAYRRYGETITYDLMKDGGNMPVTNYNVQMYVDSYVDFLLNISVKDQFVPLREGFLLVCGGESLELFYEEELKVCCEGISNTLNFEGLENNVTYRGNFTKTHPVIENFWQVVHNFSQENKRQFLAFVTSSDRVPLQGFESLNFIIQSNGPDSDLLPTASTCYNTLLLPEYNSIDKLRTKLLVAIENCYGFGLK
eukprot:TRINITY_DN8938_c0_g1_i1.p1 TRINITY_DN8938_c0_g1~~TRINITY_DN8938_c0_g1_i1.p1  ORF type:complete len:998 (-),score=180.28 TRINITY_DN8938_c0_g1_i1:21-3014(-)